MRPIRIAVPLVLVSLAAPSPARAQALSTVPLQQFEVPWGRAGRPRDAAVAPDGSIFFVGQAGQAPIGNYVARLDPRTGDFKKFELDPGTQPHTCIVDARGYVWYSGNRNGTIGRIDPATGEITRYPVPDSTVRDPHTMVFDPKGNIWFTAQGSNAVGHLDVTTGKFRIVKIPFPPGFTSRSTNPYGIVVDSKGHPWFNLFNTNMIGTIDPATMELKTFPLGDGAIRNRRIGITSDDKIYYTDYARGFLGRLDPKMGKTEEWVLPSGPGMTSRPYGMMVDNQDRVWVVETAPQPNKLVGFDPKTNRIFSITDIPGAQNTVRHMFLDKKSNMIWFGADAGFISRADVSGVRVAM